MMKSFVALLVVVGLLAIAAQANQVNKKQNEKDVDLSQPSRPNPLLHPNLAGHAVPPSQHNINFYIPTPFYLFIYLYLTIFVLFIYLLFFGRELRGCVWSWRRAGTRALAWRRRAFVTSSRQRGATRCSLMLADQRVVA
jgi:hypothetical protein